MAKPIKITPVLRGKDAINFLLKLGRENHFDSNSSSKLAEVKKDAAAFKSLIKKA